MNTTKDKPLRLAGLLYLSVEVPRSAVFLTAANLLTCLGDDTQVPVLCHAEEAAVRWAPKGK